MEEVRAYAPEFEKEIPLQIMMIEKDHVVCTAMDGNDQFIIDEIIPNTTIRFVCFKEFRFEK